VTQTQTPRTPRSVRALPVQHPDDESDTAASAESESFDNPAMPARPPTHSVPKVSRDDWLNSKMLKLLGIVYGIAAPFIVWLVITIYGHNTDIALQKMRLEHLNEKMTVVAQINEKIDSINASINKIQIDIATLKAKAGIP